MNRKMSRYKGLILSCMSVIMIVVCVCSFSFESYAENSNVNANVQNPGYEFYLDYAEPAKSPSQGYINLLLKTTTTLYPHYYVVTYYWSTYSLKTNVTDLPVYGKCIIKKNDFQFTLNAVNDANSYSYALYEFNADGDCRLKQYSTSERFAQNFGETEIVAYKAYGNVLVDSYIIPTINFSVYYSDDGSSALLMDILNYVVASVDLSDVILSKLYDILYSVDGVENQLNSVINYLNSIDTELEDIGISLDEINNKYDDLLKETKKQTSWLEKIWNSIQEFINPSDEDEEDSEKIENDTTDKKDALDELNEENKTEKTDVEDASEDVDENVDLDTIGSYGAVLSGITENEYVIQILLLVFSVAFVSYVLFGKK